MDVPLYAIALTVFAVLYLAIGVFLAFVLLITLMIMFLYLTLRYGQLPEDYPYGGRDISITMIFIGVTWGIFTFLAPKTPIPFIGNGLTYTNPQFVPINAIIVIAVVITIAFLIIFSFIGEKGQGMSYGSTAGADKRWSGEKSPQGVGA
ncbi:MAG TPA: hypothetical protein VGV89_02005 [Thermoplasmata archaeon]|nr:hypothetical protein [Thermoplasmata archaeon]